ncbi:Hsp20/alpha crystallin family protein [Desulfosediminicola flagellatus]|uniref:Hsp20/alpha crystallin family protein n=1 Tax=Desulfosediminicola flagellatus TaxID=2569541 RepID=UPI0010AC5100|nr:Hsp20/alpha crystallin family protein [Desulfosediminicola flagellatus]
MWTRTNDIDRMFSAMDLLNSRMNRLFTEYDRSAGRDFRLRANNDTPKTNLYDLGDKLQLIAELPGVAKADLNVRIQGNYLELSGSRKSEVPEGYKAHRVERGSITFTRSFTLPTDVDSERVEAVLRDGVLTMNLPKIEAAKPKQITIS